MFDTFEEAKTVVRDNSIEMVDLFLLAGGVFSLDLIERWVTRKRTEEREVRNRPHPYEIELYYGV